MQFKLFYFLFIVLVFGIFAGFNLKNSTDISLIFTTLKDIPIYLSNLFSFVIGVIIMLPFLSKRNRKNKEKNKAKLAEQEAAGVKTVDLKKTKKKRFWQRNKKENKSETSENKLNSETTSVSESKTETDKKAEKTK